MARLGRRRFTALTAAGVLGLAQLKARAFQQALQQTGLKDVFKDDFLIGTAVDGRTVNDPSTPLAQLVAREFNAITATNMMKWGPIEPREGEWQWDGPDRLVEFGAAPRHDASSGTRWCGTRRRRAGCSSTSRTRRCRRRGC